MPKCVEIPPRYNLPSLELLYLAQSIKDSMIDALRFQIRCLFVSYFDLSIVLRNEQDNKL